MNDKDHYSGDDDSHDKIASIDELIEHIMKMFSAGIDQKNGKPMIHGFTIINLPGKKPTIFGFKSQKGAESFEYEDEDDDSEGDFYIFNQDPFIEVFEAENKVFLSADLGVEEQHIEYHPYRSHVEITVITKGTGYSKVIDLPCSVDPTSMVSSYKNGVLELIFENAADTE
jgi:HSP20 family protein